MKPTLNRPVLSKPTAPAQAETESSPITAEKVASETEDMAMGVSVGEIETSEQIDSSPLEAAPLSAPPIRPAEPVPVSISVV